MKNWFNVSKQGLAKILERKGKEFALFELVQNGWDEPGVTKVAASLTYQGRNRALLVVEDDAPEGFKDLSHAFTLFAESAKVTNPEQRGRFNLGEKLVLAISDEVVIQTTQGGVRFDATGRHSLRSRRSVGSRIECLLRITPEECSAIEIQVRKLIPPPDIRTLFNGNEIPSRIPVAQFETDLPTEMADADGFLRRKTRRTTIRLYEPLTGPTAMVYEMGIPIVAVGDRWDYDIGQKVPLTLDRENVQPSFLRQVRVAVFNRMHAMLGHDDVNSEWVETAIASDDCAQEAAQTYMSKRFGDKRVSFDPSDPEANKLAISRGFTLVHGSMMSSAAWKNAKAANAILPAGQVTPSPKVWTGEDNPDAAIFHDWIPEGRWSRGMGQVAAFAIKVAEQVLHRRIVVKFCATAHHLSGASYGPSGELVFNKFRLGAEWFERGITDDVVQLIIHEFGHEYSLDHLSSEYHEALCRVGARMYACARRGKL